MSYTKILIKGEVRIYVTEATAIAQKAIEAHETKPLGSLVLATSVATFSVFSALSKFGRTSVKLDGNGPLGFVIVESNSEGDIRATIGNNKVTTEFDKTRFNDIPLTLGIGDGGLLNVSKEIEGVSFGGQVPLANGDVVTDLAYYFDQSEQVNTAIVSDIKLATPEKLERAYSVLFQMMPDHSEVDVQWVENFVKNNKLSSMSIDEYITKMDAKDLETKEIRWKCSCTDEKLRSIAESIPEKEREEIIKEHGKLEVVCNYCKRKYIYK